MPNLVEAAKAMQSRFKTLVQIPENLIVSYGNTAAIDRDGNKVATPEDATWLRTSIHDGDVKQISLGRVGLKSTRTPGIFRIQIFTPVEAGELVGREIADIIITNFRLVNASGITWKNPSARTIGRSGAWWQINTDCPYHFDN